MYCVYLCLDSDNPVFFQDSCCFVLFFGWLLVFFPCGDLISQIRKLFFHFQVTSARGYNNVNILIVNICSSIGFPLLL